LLLTTSVLYLTHYAGLSVGAVGSGLALAGIVGLAASIPGGRLGDRLGFRRGLIGLNILRGLLAMSYLLIGNFPVFLVVVSLIALVDAATSPCRGGYISQLFGNERRVAVSAYNRAVFNVGITLGAAGATVALAIGTRTAFEGLIIGDAVSYLLASPAADVLPALASYRFIRCGGDDIPHRGAGRGLDRAGDLLPSPPRGTGNRLRLPGPVDYGFLHPETLTMPTEHTLPQLNS
jgi:MFS family permease